MDDDQIIGKLTKDLREAARIMTPDEARYMVDSLYQIQENRLRADGQIRSQTGEPHAVLDWVSKSNLSLENQIKLALKAYASAQVLGEWSMKVKGIGPVISAGLLAHLRYNPPPPTVGHYWRYAGLDPSSKWVSTEDAKKWIKENSPEITDDSVRMAASHFGRKFDSLNKFATTNRDGDQVKLTVETLSKAISRRPHNASLKTLAWKVGESFVKVSGNPVSVYGKHYSDCKSRYNTLNIEGRYKEAAAIGMSRVGKSTQAYTYYSKGILPPGHIHARAKRAAVKLFLSHWHEAAWRSHFKTDPPKPFSIGIQGHGHYIGPEVEFPV